MNVLLHVLKLFVSSHPLNFKGACHFTNYLFVITYLLGDEQELSLGMLIRCKCIYNFLCSMLVLHQILYVLYALYDIYSTNLLTSATVPVPVYFVCLLQK